MKNCMWMDYILNSIKSHKFWIFVIVISYLVNNIWQIFETAEGIYEGFTEIGLFELGQSVGINPLIILIVFCPLFGLIFRLYGSILAVQIVNSIWIRKTQIFSDLSKKISKVILMEIIYLVSIIPNFFFITVVGTPVILYSYITQSLLTIPFLFILRRKIRTNSKKSFEPEVKKWIALTFVTYLGAIWVNHITRWFDMSLIGGIPMLLDALNPLGFFNVVIILSLSLILAIIGFIKINNMGILSKLFGLSMVMLGLYFIILVIFYGLQNSLHVLYLFEVWTIPFFGLGLSIILE
jgi:hypothetical protein